MEPLLPTGGQKNLEKRPCVFGWKPLWQEVVPLDQATGSTDKALCVANVGAGVMIGIRQGLSAIMTASLTFTAAGVPQLSDMFGFGITMMWFSSCIAALWYGLFGRLQYGLIGINDVIAILWGTMGGQVAAALSEEPSKIAPTQLAIIASSTVLTGVFSIVFGKLGLGKLMLLFPAPVTSGFLGSIGFFIFKSSLQIASGVKFRYLWPMSWEEFCQPQPLARVGCMLASLWFMRHVPPMLTKVFPKSGAVKKLGGLVCQLLPLAIFFLATNFMGITMDMLTELHWTYPKQGSGSPLALWTTYSLRDADWEVVLHQLPGMGTVVMMSVLCTMTGVLGITGKFPTGPSGDPAPNDTVDYDRELITAGWADCILGLSGGIVVFHRLGSTVQLRGDGGTHRIAVFTCAVFCIGLFISGIPIGHYIPTWFLGSLFMNSCIGLVQDALLSFRRLPRSSSTLFGYKLPSKQYAVTIVCILMAIAVSPNTGIMTGLAFSVFLFLQETSSSEPVSGVTSGNISVGRTKRPVWELRTLRREGDRIILLFLQGQLYFGSADHIAKTIATATEGEQESGRVKYCILSCARVIGIDASAAKQVKNSVDRAARNGVKVLFCRMNMEVFKELSVAGAIKSPDSALRKVLQDLEIDIEVVPASDKKKDKTSSAGLHDHGIDASLTRGASSAGLQHHGTSTSLAHGAGGMKRRLTVDFTPLGQGSNDAFDTETDALDYCGDLLLEEYCYHHAANLDLYKLDYRMACKKGSRIKESSWEAMNSLPEGTLARLRPSCQVMDHLDHFKTLESEGEPTLYFIMRGAIAELDMLGEEELTVKRSEKLAAEVKGFTGRQGHDVKKRLRARYTPGHVVGKTRFSLQGEGEGGLVDRSLLPRLQVSSRLSGYAEVWALKRSAFDALPSDLQRSIHDLILFQLADDRQHGYLLE